MPLALEPHADEPSLLREHRQRVGELDLASGSGLHLLENGEDVRRQDVPADHRQIGRRRPARRLLHDPIHEQVSVRLRLSRRHAVQVRLVVRDRHQRHGGLPGFHRDARDLADGRLVRVDQIVAEHHAEPIFAHGRLCRQHCMAEPERLLLPDADEPRHLADPPRLLQQLRLVFSREDVLQLVAAVEVILDRRLAAAGDQDHPSGARFHRLFDDQLDGGGIDDREHLLRDGLGDGKEARPEPGGGDDDLAQRLLHGGAQGSKGV